MKLTRSAAAAPTPSTTLDIAEATSEDRREVASAVVAGFGMPDRLAPWLGAIVGREGWRAYVARDGSSVVGAYKRANWTL